MLARASLVALLVLALAAAARAEGASEEVLQAAEKAADEADRVRVLGEREALVESDEDHSAIVKVMANLKIDLDFTDASLEDILGYMREYGKINMEIDQSVRDQGLAQKKIDFCHRDIVFRDALEDLLGTYELDYTFDHKVLLITHPRTPTVRDLDTCRSWREYHAAANDGGSKEDDEVRQAMEDTRVSLSFTDATLEDLLVFLTEYTRLRFCVDAGTVRRAAEGKITFRVEELPLEQAFDLITRMLDLCYYVQGGVIHIAHGEMTCVMTAGEDWRTAPKRQPLTHLGKNDQGYEEYRDELTGIVLVLIPGGDYQMEGKGGSIQRMRVDGPYLVSKTEVTNEQFRRYAAWRRNLRGHDSGSVQGVSLNGDQQPAVNLTWYEIQGFCRWSGMRLPTEQEWEVVARGGDDRRFPWGNEWPPTVDAGNYADVAEDGTDALEPVLGRRRDGHLATAPVGRGRPSPFGLHDLGGNVWEWCAAPVEGRSVRGAPLDTPDSIFTRSGAVLRGGSWYDARPSALRCGARLEYPANLCNPAIGFRVAMDSPK